MPLQPFYAIMVHVASGRYCSLESDIKRLRNLAKEEPLLVDLRVKSELLIQFKGSFTLATVDPVQTKRSIFSLAFVSSPALGLLLEGYIINVYHVIFSSSRCTLSFASHNA